MNDKQTIKKLLKVISDYQKDDVEKSLILHTKADGYNYFNRSLC